jgi:hypothetical protein
MTVVAGTGVPSGRRSRTGHGRCRARVLGERPFPVWGLATRAGRSGQRACSGVPHGSRRPYRAWTRSRCNGRADVGGSRRRLVGSATGQASEAARAAGSSSAGRGGAGSAGGGEVRARVRCGGSFEGRDGSRDVRGAGGVEVVHRRVDLDEEDVAAHPARSASGESSARLTRLGAAGVGGQRSPRSGNDAPPAPTDLADAEGRDDHGGCQLAEVAEGGGLPAPHRHRVVAAGSDGNQHDDLRDGVRPARDETAAGELADQDRDAACRGVEAGDTRWRGGRLGTHWRSSSGGCRWWRGRMS